MTIIMPICKKNHWMIYFDVCWSYRLQCSFNFWFHLVICLEFDHFETAAHITTISPSASYSDRNRTSIKSTDFRHKIYFYFSIDSHKSHILLLYSFLYKKNVIILCHTTRWCCVWFCCEVLGIHKKRKICTESVLCIQYVHFGCVSTAPVGPRGGSTIKIDKCVTLSKLLSLSLWKAHKINFMIGCLIFNI